MCKIKNWVDAVMKIPSGKYEELEVKMDKMMLKNFYFHLYFIHLAINSIFGKVLIVWLVR